MTISAAKIAELLTYDPHTGELFWRARKWEYFSSRKSAKTWNTRFARKLALTASQRDGYRHGYVLGTKLLAHRVIWALVKGEWPKGQIDHINGDRSDNRWHNLRDVPRAHNQRNMKTPHNNTSGHIGIYEHKPGVWRARLGRRHIGLYRTIEEAIEARRSAERKEGYHVNHGR